MMKPATGIQPQQSYTNGKKKVAQVFLSYRHVHLKWHAVHDLNPKPVVANHTLNSCSTASRLTMSWAQEQVLLLLLYQQHNTCAVANVSFRTQVCSLKDSGQSTSSWPNLLPTQTESPEFTAAPPCLEDPSKNRQLNKWCPEAWMQKVMCGTRFLYIKSSQGNINNSTILTLLNQNATIVAIKDTQAFFCGMHECMRLRVSLCGAWGHVYPAS